MFARRVPRLSAGRVSLARRAWTSGWLALAVSLSPALVACGSRDSSPTRPNVILISIDSLRADHLACYGYERPTSPAIDALAAGGVLFERAVAQAPWTLPSHASLFTSLYTRTHQTGDVSRRLPPFPTLATELAGAGYSTMAVVGGTFMQTEFGLDRGFEIYDDELAKAGHRQSHRAVTSPETLEKSLQLLGTSPSPFFLFVHFWDVHYDYIPPAPYDTLFDPDYEGDITGHRFYGNDAVNAGMDPADLEHILALYDGEIAWVDEHVAKLLSELEARGLAEDTLVVLTADHGDEFFEHGLKGHTHSLYEELLHVPLVVRGPGVPSAVRVPQRVELIDVMPTVLELVGLPVPDGAQGRSLRPLLDGAPWPPRPSFAETSKARKTANKADKGYASTVYLEERKLIQYERQRHPDEVYSLGDDPGEHNDLSASPAGAAPLLEAHRSWLERIPTGRAALHGGLDAHTLEQLKGLGYVDD